MNDLLLIILLSILSTFIFFSFAYILIKKLKINHPKDKFRIYAVVICSYIFIFLISISVIATPIEKQIINSDSSNLNNDETCSLLIVIDENQLENQNNEEFENHDCEINSCCEDECSTLSHNGSYSFFLHSSDDIQNLISKIIEIKTNTFKKIDSNKQVYEKSVVAGLSDPKVKENEKSNIGIIFLQFNIILLFLSASYLFFSLILLF